MNSGDIHLVAGISCSGKSTYIEHRINAGDWQALPVLLAHEISPGNANLPDTGCIVHYNLLRPFDNDAVNLGNAFEDDQVLVNLLALGNRVRVTLLVVHPAILAKRVLLQEQVEGSLREASVAYPHRQVFELLCRLDMAEFHARWLALFRDHGMAVKIIDAGTNAYEAIDAGQLPGFFHAELQVAYSDADIRYIIETNDFEYQRMQLGDNLFTAGDDRSPGLALLDDDLTGKSLLDIGCAYGFFCFEAEKRHASRVVGTELKRHRFAGANIVKQLTGSKVDILFRDMFVSPPEEVFDVVLLLNVLHHLKEPVRALRLIAGFCREKLVIEFPTLADSKFRTTLSAPSPADPDLPLIGVSLQGEIDQTFLFSPAAIERILLDHDALFARIEFRESPMNRERCVAFCHK